MSTQQSLWDTFYKTNKKWHKETRMLPNVCTHKRVLELGCGNGKTLKAILKQNPSEVVAIDFSEQALIKAQEAIPDTNVTFIKADATKLPQSLGTFDVIVCYYLLNNLTLSLQKKLLTLLKAFLTPQGILLIEEYAKGDHREQQTSPFQRTFLSKEQMNHLLTHYKIKTMTEQSFFPYKNASCQRKSIRASATLSESSN
jgi:ubiquinone/menaquinone biosynthesis C-methylase UbiE